ncbi:MAG TPA: 2-isopropylmalate synthase [Geobacteraceae bacterium]
MSRRIYVFDTTLRNGEQAPGAKLDLYGKLQIARQLKKLKVDYIEAGFPASPGEFQAVSEIAKAVGDDDVIITALARANKKEIDAVYESVKFARRPLIHVVLGSSNVHLEKKLTQSKEQILEQGVESVRYAKSLLQEVQYSTEDGSRTDFEYLWKTIEAVVNAGATIINIPDTVGYAVPEQFGEFIKKINDRLKNLNDSVLLSVHCHNDTGLATANTLIAVKNGADKVECTMNGVGERAGNAALEEIVMGIKLRPDYYNAYTGIETREIKRTSNLVSSLMGMDVPLNKAITGGNAFAHSGIHQDGLLKSKDCYVIIDPNDVGVEDMEFVLMSSTGRDALKNALNNLGYVNFTEAEFDNVFRMFQELADAKKEVSNEDLVYMMENYQTLYGKQHDEHGNRLIDSIYKLVGSQIISNEMSPSASIKLQKREETYQADSGGDGPIDAICTAIRNIVGMDVILSEYKINSITKGTETLGKVNVKLSYKDKVYSANATDADILKASALAYLNGINNIIIESILER